MRLEQLSRSDHAGLRIDPRKAEAAAANVHLVPLAKVELRRAALTYPLFFVKNVENGRFYPSALLGLKSQENLFFDGSRFDADYVPLNIQRLPFYVGADEDAGSMICIDAESPAIDPDGALAILEPDGTESGYFSYIQGILSELSRQQPLTSAFIDMVVELGLLAEIKLNIVLNDGEAIEIDSLYGIDERALERQIDRIESFEDKLICAAMLLSLDNVSALVRRKNARSDELADWHKPNSG